MRFNTDLSEETYLTGHQLHFMTAIDAVLLSHIDILKLQTIV